MITKIKICYRHVVRQRELIINMTFMIMAESTVISINTGTSGSLFLLECNIEKLHGNGSGDEAITCTNYNIKNLRNIYITLWALFHETTILDSCHNQYNKEIPNQIHYQSIFLTRPL